MKRLVLAAALIFATPAAAQPGLADPEANIVEELVVQALERGPAWWRVKDADTTVYILGVGEDALPAGTTWDRSVLQRRLTGAHGLIIGTRVGIKGSLRDIPIMLRARAKLRSKAPLETTLPEPLRARFVSTRERLGKPAKRYAGWGPLVAGGMLMGDAEGATKSVSIARQIEKEAKARKVKVVSPASYKARPYIEGAMERLTPELSQRCLSEALDDADAPRARREAAIRAWARGDVSGALHEPRAFQKCVLLLAGGQGFWRRFTDDVAGSVQAALGKPGHAVAVVDLRQLLAEDGVIETLEARGLRVAGPGEAL